MTQVLIDRATLEQLVVALENSVGAMYEIHHAHTNHRWFTNGEQAAIQHRNLWIRKIPELSKEAIEPITAGREALANAEPIARMQPVTKTRVGNYLNKHPMGDLTAYRHGFKDGVKWREQL